MSPIELRNNVNFQLIKIKEMSALEVAEQLERSLERKPTGISLWPEAVERIIELLKDQKPK